ncbi:MAG: hypothetical protein ABIS92_18800 [Polyangia bacterium]
MVIQTLVERLATVFAEGENKLEAMRAREEYFERAGKVFDDDGELFESRMAAFLEWYIIERNFQDGPPPALRVLAEQPGRFADEERRAAVHLYTSHRSLFELGSMAHGRLELDDLIGGARFWVQERRSTIGFETGALFEARLLWNGEAVVFGKTFLFHPPDVRERVLQLVDKAADAATPAAELMFQLSRLYVRWHRLGHLSAAKIYSGDA